MLNSSVISAPAAIMLALIMVPASEEATDQKIELGTHYHSLMDAITKGTSDGLKLMVNVGAMLLILVALVALLNSVLSLLPFPGEDPLTLQGIFGYLFAPLVWLMGIPWQEAPLAGSLMGIKTALTELVAFLALAEVPVGSLSPKSFIIMTYALCGFAKLPSPGFFIPGIWGLYPYNAR